MIFVKKKKKKKSIKNSQSINISKNFKIEQVQNDIKKDRRTFVNLYHRQ
jgi:hypothetical protein